MAKHRSKFLKMQSKVKTTYRARAIHPDGSEDVLREFNGRGWLDARSRIINVFKALTDDGSEPQKRAQARKDKQRG